MMKKVQSPAVDHSLFLCMWYFLSLAIAVARLTAPIAGVIVLQLLYFWARFKRDFVTRVPLLLQVIHGLKLDKVLHGFQ